MDNKTIETTLNKQLNILRFLLFPLGALTALYVLSVIVLFLILPMFGYTITSTVDSPSMNPLMMGETLLLEDINVAFKDLEVGDIISYRERVDADDNWTNSSFVVRNYPAGSEAPTEEQAPKYIDSGIEYKSDKNIVHRIVEIIDGQGDRAIICKGDNNPVNDPKVVMASAFNGKVIWSKSYIGAAYRWLYKDGSVLWLVAAVFIPIGVWILVLMLCAVRLSKKSTPASSTPSEK